MSLDDVKKRLGESVPLGTKEYYFTGGEPFLNPDMTDILEETLKYGPATVLSNGTVFKDEWLQRLKDAEDASTFCLEFRISIDGFSSETNDPIRGEGTFTRAIKGVGKLVEYGFMPIITAVRTWNLADDQAVIAGFTKVLNEVGYARPRLKILPTLQIGEEANRTKGYSVAERVTTAMMDSYDESLLVCNYSRIVTDRGIHVCPILIESPDSVLSDSLQDSMKPFPMSHGACLTCYQYGAICANGTAGTLETSREAPSRDNPLPILPDVIVPKPESY